MGGLFGVACKEDCVLDLFYGTDYHSHMGTCRGGLAVRDNGRIHRSIHDITNAQFRTKFDADIREMRGTTGVGVISDFDSQPLIIGSHLGTYAIVTVGRINNIDELGARVFDKRVTHFAEMMSGGGFNPTEIVATLINHEASLEDGLLRALSLIDGSMSILLMTDHGLYAARDLYGRTPLIVGRKDGGHAVTMESAALPNLDYEVDRYLGPGEVVRITPEGVEQLKRPGDTLQVCAFLWVYFGFPASAYEGINVEQARSRCGAALARRDDVEVDLIAGIPDSGVGHAIGYANESKTAYARPFAKYTPTWPRSFMPQDQRQRDLVARMKLIPIKDVIRGQRILFCDDSIVRGTQLKDTIQRLYDCGAKEIHLRVACPPLLWSCRFLNFSRSKSVMDLAARHAMKAIGADDADVDVFATPDSPQYNAIVEYVRKRLNLDTLHYQLLGDLVEAIGLPKEKLCTYCWDGCDARKECGNVHAAAAK
jgi:amidophosphoribosyltransferase